MSESLRQTGPAWLPKIAGAICGLALLGSIVSAATSTSPSVAPVTTSASSPLPTVDKAPDPVPTTAEPEPEPTTEKAEPEKKEPTLPQREALEAAQSYVDSGHFSKKGLMEQLTSPYGEDFDKDDAEWAVARVEVDYNQEAAEAAQSYLDSGHFSKASLMEQLTSPYGEQFTKKQAAYGVKAVGL